MKRTLFLLTAMVMFMACSKSTGDNTATTITSPELPGSEPEESGPVFDGSAENAPRFVAFNYIDLDSIAEISRFRSGIGHDYSDDFESCRSMKHYFKPKVGDWSHIRIYAPADGTVINIFPEWAGKQVHIRSKQYPAFTFKIFHVNLDSSIQLGAELTAGARIGTHIGSQTMSDIAVAVQTSVDGPKDNSNSQTGLRLFSIFDVMTDSLFASYGLRGISARQHLIISEADRQVNNIECNGEGFVSTGTIENWVPLQ